MILYKNTAIGYRNAVDDNYIVDDLEAAFIEHMGHSVSPAEKNSWNNSLQFMEKIIRRSEIPDDSGILLEYNIPATAKRIDFIVSGHDEEDRANFVIIELKQWNEASSTDLEYLVTTYVGGGIHPVTHPAYQAYSYKQFLRDMNTAIADNDLRPYSCAYLHNYKKQIQEPLLSEQYAEICEDTPVFFSEDNRKLEAFIRKYVGKGNGMDILYEIEHGKVKPSKKFVEYVSDMFDGNNVYTLLDEQQVAYANIMKYASNAKKRMTILVNGGPGTGKSVVAMNAFVSLFRQGKNIRFVAPNASFREAMIDMLARQKKNKKSRLKEIFSGSMNYYDAKLETFDALIVDEAHRLKSKGTYMYRGKSQVDDIIKASKVNIFFIDDNQRIRPNDEGTVKLIKATAAKHSSEVIEVELKAQFRCSGAEGFLNWVDHNLQIVDTANYDGWDEESFEFKIVDHPSDLEKYVSEKNQQGFKARMLAGFAWPWTSQKDGNPNAEVNDVSMPEYNFAKPWNSRKDQYTWAIDNTKQHQIGCVHTSQGLEFDYVGVIIGNDLKYNPGTMEIEGDYENYYDTSGKKGLKKKPEELAYLLKNIYKILLSRGMRGCCLFCRDKNLQEHLKRRLKSM